MALWRRLAEVSDFRAALQTSAVTTLAAEPPPTAKLTSFELSYRTKLNAKRAATGATKNEGPSLVDWLRDLQLPGHIAIKPEFAVWFDSEHSILKAMRCRRNDTFWPWMVNAQMIPAEVTGVDPSDVPPQLRNVFGDVFLRLTALPPCKPDPVTGEAASTLPLPVFVWFFTTVCQLLYPGSHNAATAFVTEEWRLSSVTSVSLSTAAWLRRDMGPDGATPARRVLRAKEAAAPPAPDRKRKANERTHDTTEAESTMLSIADVTEDSEPGVSFPLFSALLRVLAEPLTRCEASASLDPTMAALKETMHLIETYLVPHCFKDECIRRYLRSNKPGGEKESPVVSPAAAPAEPPSPAVKPKLEHTNSNASLNASTTLNTSATGGLVLPSLGRAPRSMVHVTSSTPVPPPSTSLLLVDHRSSQQHDVMTPPENKHATAAARNSGFLSTAIATAVAKTQVPQVGQIKLPPLLLPSAVS